LVAGDALTAPPSTNKNPANISLRDVFVAIEGPQASFHCTEVRQKAPCAASKSQCAKPCIIAAGFYIAASFYDAEKAFRASLQEVSILDVLSAATQGTDKSRVQRIGKWINEMSANTAGA